MANEKSKVTSTEVTIPSMTDLVFLEEYTWRWKNHMQMLETIQQSNIDPDIVKRWTMQINMCFKEKLLSKL